jgi:hypothetical protein
MQRFMTETLYQIVETLRPALSHGPVQFEAMDPSATPDLFAGEETVVCGHRVRYRSLHEWMELAESLGAVVDRIKPLPDGFLGFDFRPLRPNSSWHEGSRASGDREKYGTDTQFARTQKLESPSFLVSYLEALDFVALPPNARVLALGVNQGQELSIFQHRLSEAHLETLRFVGIDHCPSAIAAARERFQHPSFQFLQADLGAIETLCLGRFDLILAINTLHSPALDGHALFQQLIREQLRPHGSVVIGLPNSRHVDHQLVYGAKMKNYSTPDLSLVLREVGFYRRYLYQHGFQVRLMGKHVFLVVGRRRSAGNKA